MLKHPTHSMLPPETRYSRHFLSGPPWLRCALAGLRKHDVDVARRRAAGEGRSEGLRRATGRSNGLDTLLPAALADGDGRTLIHGGDSELGTTVRSGGRRWVALAELDGARDTSTDLEQRNVGLVHIELPDQDKLKIVGVQGEDLRIRICADNVAHCLLARPEYGEGEGARSEENERIEQGEHLANADAIGD